jgi:hypothetical protein
LKTDAWKTLFNIVAKEQGHFLIVKKGEGWSYNMVMYKSKGRAERGARAAFNKINKEFEKNFLINE